MRPQLIASVDWRGISPPNRSVESIYEYLRLGRPSTVTNLPETHYADTRNGRVAYQVIGDGPLDLLVFHPPICPVDLLWDEPMLVRFLEGLSTFSRSIWFDPRGRGASDPLPHDEDRFEESSTDDMLGVIDHLGLQQVAVLGLKLRLFFLQRRTLNAPKPSCCTTALLGTAGPRTIPSARRTSSWSTG